MYCVGAKVRGRANVPPMNKRTRRLAALLIASLVLVFAIAWSVSHQEEAAGQASEVGVDRADGAGPVDNGARSNVADSRPMTTPAAPKPQKQDALLESLRSKLTAPNVVATEALLTFRSAEARERFLQEAAAHGLEVLDTIAQLNSVRVRYGSLEGLRDAIASQPDDFADVQGNLWLTIPEAAPPPAPDPNNQGGRAPFGYNTLAAINAGGDRTHWGDNITVAVLDTGVLPHPTFAEGEVTHVDLVNDGQPFNSHGTSVASMIGGQDAQVPGVAPGAKILDIRVAGADGYSISSTMAQGIVTATDRGAQVINISFGAYGDDAVMAAAVNYATQHGVVVVAAAGNDAYGQLAIPAAYDSVISVGSVDANGRQAFFSNAGTGLDLVAPGVGVVSAWDTDKIAFVSGTSQSAALVSGAAATYLSWGVPASSMTTRLKADAQPAFNSSGLETGAGVLMIKPPPRY